VRLNLQALCHIIDLITLGLNIGAYKEAAEHFLSALMMQESVGGDKSEQLWQTLRKCFVSMEREDLAEAAKSGQSLDRFKQEGFDF
jgi:peroxin-5